MAISRREAIKLSGLAVATTAINGYASSSDAKSKNKIESLLNNKAPIADTNNPRVVVVGGGWSGLSIAKYTKIFAPNTDVIIVEQRYKMIDRRASGKRG